MSITRSEGSSPVLNLENDEGNEHEREEGEDHGSEIIEDESEEILIEHDEKESLESYESVDSTGEIVVKYRRKPSLEHEQNESIEDEDEDEASEEKSEIIIKERTQILPDVFLDKWLTKEMLEEMMIEELRNALIPLYEEIEVLQTENFVFDQTVLKMEKREIEIEAALPPFTYKFPWEREVEGVDEGIETKALHPDDICGELSDDEPDPPDGIYKAYIPAQDPNFDREALEQMLQIVGEDGETISRLMSVTHFLESIGEIPPSNFDVIRHKYGDLVRFSKYPKVDEKAKGYGIDFDPLAAELREEDQQLLKNSRARRVDFGTQENNIIVEDEDVDISTLVTPVADFEEDPDFPEFNPLDAKRLPIGEKIKYAHIEEESMRENFYQTESKGIQQENSIQVYIDTYMDSYDLSTKMNEVFKNVVEEGIHPLTGKMKAEKIRRFREKLKKKLLEEEAKVKIKLTETMKQKRRVDKQLKISQDIGGTIQMIDYENLRIQNYEYQTSIDDQMKDLKKLKYITTEWFEKLERNKDRLNRQLTKRRNLENDVTVRNNLKNGLYESVRKTNEMTNLIDHRCSYLKRRLLAFSAPSTIEYMKLKSNERKIEEDVVQLRNKVNLMIVNLEKTREQFKYLMSIAPDKSAMKQSTESWLKSIKKEVEDNNLMSLLNDEDENYLINFKNQGKEKQKDLNLDLMNLESRSVGFLHDPRQSSMYAAGMTQSVTEVYAVTNEKKRLKMIRRHHQHKK